MTEHETNVEGDCLNMSECGIYENGTSMVPLRPLMINSRKKAMKLTWISGYSDFECNLSIWRYERTNHFTRRLQGMSLYCTTGLAAGRGRVVSKRWRGGNCCSKTMVRLSNGCVQFCAVTFIGNNVMYAGSIDETLKEATLLTSALRTPNQQKRRACRLVEI